MKGIERLRELIKGQQDKPLNKVVDYLCTREDMDEKYINPEKDLKGMIDFIRGEARKQAKDGMAMIDDEEVYGWAVHYFDESNEKLGIGKSTSNKKETDDDSDEEEDVINKSTINDEKPKVAQFNRKSVREDAPSREQLALF
jgi:hypothetical protein